MLADLTPARYFKQVLSMGVGEKENPSSIPAGKLVWQPPPQSTANDSKGICKAFQGSQLFVAINLLRKL